MSINKAIILGNVGNDPIIYITKNNKKLCSLSVATNNKWKDNITHELKEKTEWHNVILFEKLAEIAETYLKKGSKIYIEGSLTTKKWIDKNNVNCYKTEIIGSKIEILSYKDNNNILPQSKNESNDIAYSFDNIITEDIPF